jgi:hypothetical protein
LTPKPIGGIYPFVTYSGTLYSLLIIRFYGNFAGKIQTLLQKDNPNRFDAGERGEAKFSSV